MCLFVITLITECFDPWICAFIFGLVYGLSSGLFMELDYALNLPKLILSILRT